MGILWAHSGAIGCIGLIFQHMYNATHSIQLALSTAGGSANNHNHNIPSYVSELTNTREGKASKPQF